MITKQEALDYHSTGRKGKIEVRATKPVLHKKTYRWPIHRAWRSRAWKSRKTRWMLISIQPRETWWRGDQWYGCAGIGKHRRPGWQTGDGR